MSAQSTALAPSRTGPLGRRVSTSTGLAIGSIAVAGAIVVAAAVVGLSRSPAAPLAERGGTGHLAPVTSTFERAIESGSPSLDTAGASFEIVPSSQVVQSATTGLDARLPSAESPLEQAIASHASITATARAVRTPPIDAPLEQAIESAMSSTASASTIEIGDANGLVHRLPMP